MRISRSATNKSHIIEAPLSSTRIRIARATARPDAARRRAGIRMKRPDAANDAELRKHGAKSVHIRSISVADLARGDPFFPISPRITQSPGSAIRTAIRPHTQPLVVPADSFIMNFEFPAVQNRGPHRERPRPREPKRIVLPDQRVPSRREVRSVFRKQTPKRGGDAAEEQPEAKESIFALPVLMF
jgi:hypothetical protein